MVNPPKPRLVRPSLGPSEFDSLRTLEEVFAQAVREDPALRAEMEVRLHPYLVTLRLVDLDVQPTVVEATLELRAPAAYGVKLVVNEREVTVHLVDRPKVSVTIPIEPEWDIVRDEVMATQRNGTVNVRLPRTTQSR